jgi:hypothetical protein
VVREEVVAAPPPPAAGISPVGGLMFGIGHGGFRFRR